MAPLWTCFGPAHQGEIGAMTRFGKNVFRGAMSHRRLVVLAMLVVAQLAIPAVVRADGRFDRENPQKNGKMSLSAYETALQYLQKSECRRGQEILEPMIKQGPGNEVALLDIGYCYIQQASQSSDPAEALRLRRIGVNWIQRAANAGQRRAQEELIRQYLEGGVLNPDPKEAGKWFLIWKSNRGSFQADPSESDEQLEKKLRSILTEADWDAARERSTSWHPVFESDSTEH